MSLLVTGTIAGAGVLVAGAVIGPTVKVAMDIAPFLYTNTRISSKAGMILNKKTYDSMIASSSMQEVFTILEGTSYSYVAEHAKSFSEASTLLEKDVFENYHWLEEVMPQSISNIVTALKLKFEVNEIKEVLNKLMKGEKIEQLHFIQDRDLRLKLESCNDFSSMINCFEGTNYQSIFANKEQNQVHLLNTDLDRYYISYVKAAIDDCKDRKAAQPFKDFWIRMIDLFNVRLVFRKISSGEDFSLVDDGSLSKEILEGVTDINKMQEILEDSPYKDLIAEIDEFNIESAVFKHLQKEAEFANAKYPLKGGPIVKYIIQKELEFRNLNVVLKLKSENFEQEEITKLVI